MAEKATIEKYKAYNTITKTTGKDKVIDFRDCLTVANLDDYANVHGAGGKDKAPISVIKAYLCDYTAGTGENSSYTVHASLSPELCAQLLEICKNNIGTQVIDPALSILAEQRAVNQKLTTGADMNFGILNNVLKILDRIVSADEEGKGTPAAAAVAKGLSGLLTKTRDKVLAPANPVNKAPILIPRHMDFNYKQDRVHAFGKDITEGKIVPVQQMQIYHQTFRKGGQLSNYPWTIKIIEAKAPVHIQPTGATSFSSSAMTDTKEAFIQISDMDMYRMMSQICRYVSVWENTIAANMVKQGWERKETERKAYIERQRQQNS